MLWKTFTCLIVTSSVLTIDPFTEGPHSVDYNHINAEWAWVGELDHNLEVYTPSSPGTYPLVMFFPGLACTTPASQYSRVLRRVASWGYTVVGPWAALYNPITTYQVQSEGGTSHESFVMLRRSSVLLSAKPETHICYLSG